MDRYPSGTVSMIKREEPRHDLRQGIHVEQEVCLSMLGCRSSPAAPAAELWNRSETVDMLWIDMSMVQSSSDIRVSLCLPICCCSLLGVGLLQEKILTARCDLVGTSGVCYVGCLQQLICCPS